jgi:hypothetical protein
MGNSIKHAPRAHYLPGNQMLDELTNASAPILQPPRTPNTTRESHVSIMAYPQTAPS